MASSQQGSDPCGQAVKLEDTFMLLDAQEISVVEGIRRLILEHLSSGKEPWLVNTLVEYYYRTRSTRAQEIIAEIREPWDKLLMEKLQEGLRAVETRIQAMQLLLYLVDCQPPWTHRLVDRPLFPTLIKCLKSEVDIPILMTGVMVLVILLPAVPVTIEAYLQDIFEVFARISGLVIKKPANSPDIYMLHLHIGVYVLFLRLYGMFPCTFLGFLRSHYAKKENLMVYNDIIVPILEKVRFHPNLVSGCKEAETSKSRWRRVEPQDIVVNCAKMSLDPIEGTWEELRCPITPQRQPEVRTSMKQPSKPQRTQDKPWQEKMEAVSEMFPVVIDPASYGFSPSQMLGLFTPPTSQRATPAASFNDLSASLQQSAGGTVSVSPQMVTPTPDATPREPLAHADDAEKGQGHSNKTTPVPLRGVPKNTPVALNRTQGTSAFTSPFLFSAPVSSQPPSAGPSPMKPNLSSDSLSSQVTDSGASRTLTFNRIPEEKEEGLPRHIEIRLGKEGTGAGAAGPVPMESLPAIVRNLALQDSEPLDHEVCRITDGERHLGNNTPVTCEDATSASAPKTFQTAESVIQFMKKVNRIRFNSLTSHNSEPLMLSAEKHTRPGRARSCPPLHRKPQGAGGVDSHAALSPSSAQHAANSKLDTVSESAVAMHVGIGEGEARRVFSANRSVSTSSSQRRSRADLYRSVSAREEGSEASACGHSGLPCPARRGEEMGRDGAGALRGLEQLASVWQCMLAPVRLALCRHCQQVLVSAQGVEHGSEGDNDHYRVDAAAKSDRGIHSWVKLPVAEQALYSAISPPELLDRHLAQGSELHAKELAHIPLTSRDNVSWTHFGGGPPVDEINILRGEILLLSNQVMYERHKRSNHAMRNRRLLRRIAHVSALEEQVQALTRELSEQGKDIQNLQVSLKLLQDHNHHLQQLHDSDEYEKLVDFRTTIQNNKDLNEANSELKNLLLTQKAENDELKKELQQVRARSFELQKDNEMMRIDLTAVHKWKSQVLQLQKERLLMGEAQDRLQNHLEQQQRAGQDNAALVSSMLVQALKADVKELKKDKMRNAMALEAAQCRLLDLEEFTKTKDLVTSEMKNNFEAAKATHAEELKVAEDKYRSMLHVCQQLDAHVLKLQAENDSLQQKLVSSQLRASRRHSDHAASPTHHPLPHQHHQRGATSSPSSSPSPPTAEEVKEACVELSEGGTGSSPRRHDPRRVSQMSKDSGHGSMLRSERLSQSAPIPEAPRLASANMTTLGDASTLSSSSSEARAPLPLPSEARSPPQRLSESRSLASRGGKTVADLEAQADGVSQSSDGPQGLAESRAMLYTDSEDNASYSSNSNLTTDSGVYSKVEPTT